MTRNARANNTNLSAAAFLALALAFAAKVIAFGSTGNPLFAIGAVCLLLVLCLNA